MKPVTTCAKKKRKARNKNLKTYHGETLEDTGQNRGEKHKTNWQRQDGAQRLNWLTNE